MSSCSKVSGGSYMKKGGNGCGSKVGGIGHEEKKGGNMYGVKLGGIGHEEKKGGMGCGSRKKRGGDQYDERSFKSASEGSTSTLSSGDKTETPKNASEYMSMGGKNAEKEKQSV